MIGLLLALVACEAPVRVDVEGDPPEHLSAYRFLDWDGQRIRWSDGMVPYELNTPLFSDYALKERALYVPPGEALTYAPDAAFTFPVGSAIVKNFLFPADLRAPDQGVRLVETRVLLRAADGWTAWPYLWNDAQTEATLAVGGSIEDVTLVDRRGETLQFAYLVPQKNQCAECHTLQDAAGEEYLTPIGPKARYLHREGQLAALAGAGLLEGLPADPPAAFDFRRVEAEGVAALSYAEIERAARDWLDVNCAHCHNPQGTNGVSSQLFLNHDNDDPFHLGVCKRPGSAGGGGDEHTWDIVPGDHQASILWYRTDTTEVGRMMPDIGRALSPREGSDLLAAWIDGMEGSCEE